MAEIRIGMTYIDFFQENKEALKKLSKEQRQKIANLYSNDIDRHITNEVEAALLKGFISKDGRVKMPEGNPTLFKERDGEVAIHDIYESETGGRIDIHRDKKDGSPLTFTWNSATANDSEQSDHLEDVDGDGYADKRVLYTRVALKDLYGTKVWFDNDLDGIYEYTNQSSTQKDNILEYLDIEI